MNPDSEDKSTRQNKPTETEDATPKRHHPEQAIPKEINTMLPTWPETTEAAKIDEKIESEEIVKLKPVQILKQEKMRSKMTRKEIKKQMEKALERGDYKMKVGRLLFWDFGGQYVFYTTHQSFMTYRALFLVVFDGSTNLYDEVPDMLCFPGQHGTTTAAGIHCLR
jgi:GTPase SAR1 family protein